MNSQSQSRMSSERLIRLTPRAVAKPWGRRDLPAPFSAPDGGQPIGEIWFDHPVGGEAELLVKYLFTAERLSIQVHPDDEAARLAGQPHGKDELWAIIAAEPGAVIGLGLRERIGRSALRQAAQDGSIETLIDWRPVATGDVIASPAGTIHALGAGLILVEIQQNLDLTYRLYDYGRQRELHLEQGVAAAHPAPLAAGPIPRRLSGSREVLAEGGFTVERLSDLPGAWLHAARDSRAWLVPLSAGVTADGAPLPPHSAWLAQGKCRLSVASGALLLLAYCSPNARTSLVSEDRPGNS